MNGNCVENKKWSGCHRGRHQQGWHYHHHAWHHQVDTTKPDTTAALVQREGGGEEGGLWDWRTSTRRQSNGLSVLTGFVALERFLWISLGKHWIWDTGVWIPPARFFSPPPSLSLTRCLYVRLSKSCLCLKRFLFRGESLSLSETCVSVAVSRDAATSRCVLLLSFSPSLPPAPGCSHPGNDPLHLRRCQHRLHVRAGHLYQSFIILIIRVIIRFIIGDGCLLPRAIWNMRWWVDGNFSSFLPFRCERLVCPSKLRKAEVFPPSVIRKAGGWSRVPGTCSSIL